MFNISLLRRIFSVFISLFLFFPTIFDKSAKYEPISEKDLVLSAVVFSDIHMEGNNPERFNRIGNTFNQAFAKSRKPDVVAFAGDNTMNGQLVEWFDFYGFVNRFNKTGKTVVAFGNHDLGNKEDQEVYKKYSKRCIENYNSYCGENIKNVYYSTEVKGYKFIVLGTEKNGLFSISILSKTQLDWLKAELKEAADKNMPAFVINHNMVAGKNSIISYLYSNTVEQSEELAEILENSGTKVVYFSGHAHEPLSAESIDTVGDCTYVNLPCAGTNFDYENAVSEDSYGTGCCMEVYQNSIILRFRCFGENRWLEGYDKIVIDL